MCKVGDTLSAPGIIMSTVGDTVSTNGGVQYNGGYHEYTWGLTMMSVGDIMSTVGCSAH